MSDQIRMTPETMRSRAKEYLNQAEAVGEVISKMDILLDNLQSEWEGQASRSYAERYGQLKPSFEDAQKLIEQIATALTQTANIVEETDKNIASQFQGQ